MVPLSKLALEIRTTCFSHRHGTQKEPPGVLGPPFCPSGVTQVSPHCLHLFPTWDPSEFQLQPRTDFPLFPMRSRVLAKSGFQTPSLTDTVKSHDPKISLEYRAGNRNPHVSNPAFGLSRGGRQRACRGQGAATGPRKQVCRGVLQALGTDSRLKSTQIIVFLTGCILSYGR